jgi:vacuolar-type H+-ATPase subunit F/Vma7
MTPLVVGTREDVAGFALIGIDGVVCATPDEAAAAIAHAATDALVMISADFADAMPRDRFIVALPARS